MTTPIDLFVQSYTNSNKEPILDFEVTKTGELASLFGQSAIKQRAVVASFTQRGSIPQLPETGVEWSELLTELVSPANVNSEIFEAIHNCADTYEYLPQYTVVDGKLIVDIKEQ